MSGLETIGIVVFTLLGTLVLIKVGMKCWKKYKYRNLPNLVQTYSSL